VGSETRDEHHPHRHGVQWRPGGKRRGLEFTKALTVADRAHALLWTTLRSKETGAHALMFLGR
jgi:hypothetical protein